MEKKDRDLADISFEILFRANSPNPYSYILDEDPDDRFFRELMARYLSDDEPSDAPDDSLPE